VTAPRRTLTALAGVAATLVAMAWLPASALAQPNISITSAGLDGSGDPYDLTVVANDGNNVQIQTMTAHVFDSGNNDVADPVMQYSSGPDDAQVWVPVNPIPQSELPPGTYTVTVDANDGTESDTGLAAPGSFSFSYTSTLTVTANPQNVSAGSQNVTFNGTLTGVAPGGSPVPISGAPVSLSISGGSAISVPSTDSNGQFSYTVDNVSQTNDYNFTVAGTSTYGPASDDVTVPAQVATTSISVTPTPLTVTQGSQDVTFNGTVQVTPPGGSPTGIGSGVPVFLSIGGGTPTQVTTTDDANGDFSYPVNNITTSTDYDFSVQAGTLYTAASADVTVNTVAAPTTLTVTPSPAAVSEGQQNVTFTGTVQVTPSGGSLTGIGAGVPVDLSIGGVSQGAVTTTTDANGDFSYTVDNVTTATDYDFSVAGTSLYTGAAEDIVVPITPAVTTVQVTASPTDVTFGSQSVTFTGSVTALAPGSSTAAGVASAPVDLSISGVSQGAVTTTDSNGHFSYTVSNITTGTDYDFSVAQGPDDLYGAANDDVNVPINPGTTNIMVTASPPDVHLNSSTVVFSGSVTVIPPGSTTPQGIGAGVQVYMSVGGGAAAPVTTTSDASGDFSLTVNNITQPNDYTFSVPKATLYTAGSDVVPIGLNQLNTNLTITPSQMNVTEGSQTVTFHGTVTGSPPGSMTQENIGSGVPIDLSIGSGPLSQVATTNTSSQFSYTAKNISKVTAFNFSVGSTTTYTAATYVVSIGLSPAKTRITGVSVTPAHLIYGQKATLKATVQYRNGKTWTDVPGALVKLAEGKTNLGSARASKTGRFTATLATTHGFGWSATLPAGNLVQEASATGNLSIAVPTKVQSFTASLGVNGDITATGCLEVTVPVGYAPPTKMNIQYEASTRGPWKTLGQLPLRDVTGPPSRCGAANQSHFRGSLRVKLPNAYYRAVLPGSYSFETTASKVVHLWKYPTKVTNYKISPRAIKTKQVATISGQLWVKTKGWRPFAKQKVEIIYNDKGTSFWAVLTTVTTNSRGDFTARAAAPKGTFVAIFYAQYSGSKTDFAVRSAGIDLSINPRKSPATSPQGPSPGASGVPVILGPAQLGFADAVQQVLSATDPLTARG
jgi:hypothetical protein